MMSYSKYKHTDLTTLDLSIDLKNKWPRSKNQMGGTEWRQSEGISFHLEFMSLSFLSSRDAMYTMTIVNITIVTEHF